MTDVLIRNKAGVEYAINAADFKRGKHALNDHGELVTYEDAGYEIIHEHPSGLPYEAPAAREHPARLPAPRDEAAK